MFSTMAQFCVRFGAVPRASMPDPAACMTCVLPFPACLSAPSSERSRVVERMAPGNHCSRLFLLSVASSFEWRPLGGEAFVVSRTLQTHPGPALGWCSTSSASRQHARDRVAGLTRLVSNMNAADTAAEAVGAWLLLASSDGSPRSRSVQFKNMLIPRVLYTKA